MGKAQRYFAFDLERPSDRLFDASGIETIEVVIGGVQHRGTAPAQPVQQCSTGSKKSAKASEHHEAKLASNCLKRKENALGPIALIICRAKIG